MEKKKTKKGGFYRVVRTVVQRCEVYAYSKQDAIEKAEDFGVIKIEKETCVKLK